jgi:4-hydroxy-tetrahydrodipicolinate synthase
MFGQVLTAMVTPFTETGDMNYPVAEKLALHLVEHGTDTLVLCGTTGESPTLTREEEYELFQVVRKAVGDKAKIIGGTGSNSTHEAIEATQQAAKLGLDGSLLVVPYYNRPPQEGLYEHFRQIAAAVPGFPLMLYNIPSRTGQNLQAETVARLAEIDNIVAIKEASGNLDQVGQIRRLTPSDFCIYCGDDSLTLPYLSIGAAGIVSVASHFVGELLQKMVSAFLSGQPQVATEIHLQLLPLFKSLFATTNPIPVKTALHLQGWQVGSTRLPLPQGSDQLKQLLQTTLMDLALL